MYLRQKRKWWRTSLQIVIRRWRYFESHHKSSWPVSPSAISKWRQGMWTVSACGVTFCIICEREQTSFSNSHWIVLICLNHARMAWYWAASPLPQDTSQINIWQLGGCVDGVGGGFGVILNFSFVFPLSLCQPLTCTWDLIEHSFCDWILEQ